MDRVRLLREPAKRHRDAGRSEEYLMVGVYELLRTGGIKKKSLGVCCGKRKIETYAERHLLVEISRKTGYDLIRGRDVVKCHDLFFLWRIADGPAPDTLDETLPIKKTGYVV